MIRNICFALLTIGLFNACQSSQDKKHEKLEEQVAHLYDTSLKPFYHGVASGDPLSDRVVIWTRVTPDEVMSSINVEWQLSDDENFSSIIQKDTTSTTPLKDYTVKIDVSGLEPNHQYFYRFKALGKTSAVGRTKTLPLGAMDSLKFAIVSCSNWEFGYFNAYDRIAERDVDAVIHLGDYIYEYAPGGYGNKNVDRKHLPPYEVVSLQDYRTRYSQYHLDKGLRNVRQRHPMITIWDDHEVANNVFTGGAQNHQPDKEGDFEKRKAAAKQAYYEWIPIRESKNHYRSFSFGDLADLVMLDERLAGKTKPVDSVSDPTYQDVKRSMLGEEQLKWFEEQLKNSKATWKIIGNQVIFSDMDMSPSYPNNPKNLDSWDGYPAEKRKISDFIRDNQLKNIIFLAGDTHASWAFEVLSDDKKKNKNSSGAIAVELGTTSITSSNWNEYTTDDTVKMGEANYLKANPHLKYNNQRDHGYLILTLYPQKARAAWYYVETLLQPDVREHLGKTLEVKKDLPKFQ